jgi:outer membrane receptor protein involved in Fe transport
VIDGSFINWCRDESARLDLKLEDGFSTGIGELRAEVLAGYLVKRTITDVSGKDINLRGTFDLTQSLTGTAYPVVLSQAHLQWQWAGWAAYWSTDFIGSYRETVDRNGFLTTTNGQVRTVGSAIYHDVTLERTWASAASLRFSVENLFDHAPPRVNNGLEDNTDSSTYPLEGRLFSLTLQLMF